MIDWCNANQGFVTAVLTLIYVATTVGLAIFAWRSNRLAQLNLQTLTALEEERLRPFVVVELWPEIPIISIRISNKGQTSASDITFSINPPLRMLMGGEGAIPKEKAERPVGFLERGIKCLVPGQVVSTVVGSFGRVRDAYPDLLFQGQV